MEGLILTVLPCQHEYDRDGHSFFPTKITVRDVDIEQLQQKDNVSSSGAVIKRIFLSEMCLQMRKVSSVVIQRSGLKETQIFA